MRRLTSAWMLCLLLAYGGARAEEPEKTESGEAGKTTLVQRAGRRIAATAGDDYEKFRVGGYGEVVAAFKDYGINRFYGGDNGNRRTHRNTISIPRFVLAFDYKFTSRWILGAEIEFESGGTGTALELENAENGEYETELEKGGEVALEQFHITRLIHPAFNVRVGHMVLPVGLTNAHHEPVNFFGTPRARRPSCLPPGTRRASSSSAPWGADTPPSTTRPSSRRA